MRDDDLDDSLDDSDPGILEDNDFGDEPETVPCPYCGQDISEMAEVCPHCKNYISNEDAPLRPQARWVKAVTIVLIVVFVLSCLLIFLR